MSMKIPMSDGHEATVSDVDFERLSVYTWHPVWWESRGASPYVGRIRQNFVTGRDEVVLMHDDVLRIERAYPVEWRNGMLYIP